MCQVMTSSLIQSEPINFLAKLDLFIVSLMTSLVSMVFWLHGGHCFTHWEPWKEGSGGREGEREGVKVCSVSQLLTSGCVVQ